MAPKQTRVLKRCAKCGKTASVRTRVRHCYKPGVTKLGTPSGYACWGDLTPVVSTKPKSKRDDYGAKLHTAHKGLAKAVTRLRRVSALVVESSGEGAIEALPRMKSALAAVERWRKRVNYYEAKVGQTPTVTRTRKIVVAMENQ